MRSPIAEMVALLGTAAIACAPPAERARTRAVASAIQGGQSDTAHPFAVGLELRDGSLCSGTLIAPNLVLTARHCIASDTGGDAVDCADTFRAPMRATDVFVTIDPVMSQSAKYVGVSSIAVPTEAGFCGNDIALLILDAVLPASAATPATPVVQFSMTDRSKVGTTLVAMGYGITGPAQNDSGRRRVRRSVSVRCIPGDAQIDCAPQDTESPREFITQGFACEGDSGGGAFDQGSFDKGDPLVLGVLSRAIDSQTTCLDATYTRTDAFSKLLIDTAQKAADQGGYPYPAWTGLTPKSPDPGTPGTEPQPTPAPEGPGDGSASRPAQPTQTTTTTNSGCAVGGPLGDSGGTGRTGALVVLAGAATMLRRRRPRR